MTTIDMMLAINVAYVVAYKVVPESNSVIYVIQFIVIAHCAMSRPDLTAARVSQQVLLLVECHARRSKLSALLLI